MKKDLWPQSYRCLVETSKPTTFAALEILLDILSEFPSRSFVVNRYRDTDEARAADEIVVCMTGSSGATITLTDRHGQSDGRGTRPNNSCRPNLVTWADKETSFPSSEFLEIYQIGSDMSR